MATVNKVRWGTGEAWQVRYTDQHGKRRKKNFDRKREADDFKIEVERQVRDGTHVHDRDSVTIGGAADIWLEAVRLGRDGRDPAEPSTIRSYEQHVRLHINPHLGGIKLSRLTTPRVVEFRDELLRGGRSRPMVKKILGSLKAMITEAQSRGLVGSNVASPVSIVTTGRHKERVVIPTKEEIRDLVTMADHQIDYPPTSILWSRSAAGDARRRMTWFALLVKTAILTGMRASELRGLAWGNIDLKAGTISVTQRADDRGKIGPVKSEKGRRRISIPDSLRRDLLEWKLWSPNASKEVLRQIYGRSPMPADPQLVFANGQGKPEPLQNIYRRFWFPLQRAAGLVDEIAPDEEVDFDGVEEDLGEGDGKPTTRPRYGVHALRHFRASVLIESGADPKDVQAELGHSSIQMTFDTYGHLFPDHVERSRSRSEKIAATLFPERKGKS